jgi:hypothetical protein
MLFPLLRRGRPSAGERDHLQPVGITEALDMNNPVAALFHRRIL